MLFHSLSLFFPRSRASFNVDVCEKPFPFGSRSDREGHGYSFPEISPLHERACFGSLESSEGLIPPSATSQERPCYEGFGLVGFFLNYLQSPSRQSRRDLLTVWPLREPRPYFFLLATFAALPLLRTPPHAFSPVCRTAVRSWVVLLKNDILGPFLFLRPLGFPFFFCRPARFFPTNSQEYVQLRSFFSIVRA